GAIAALEEGNDRDRGYVRRGRRSDYHAVFLAGLYLESGNLDGVDEILETLQAIPGQAPMTIPGIAFHLACRRDDVEQASRLLDEVLRTLAIQGWHGPDMAHDLVSAGLHVGLPLDRLGMLAEALLPPDSSEPWRAIVEAQLAEARGDTE